MKARDIIPGWPRGRSTLAQCEPNIMFVRPLQSYLAAVIGMNLERLGFDEAARVLSLEVKVREGRQANDLLCHSQEVLANRAYHEAQQKMVDEFRTNNSNFAENLRGRKVFSFFKANYQ